MDKKSFLAQLGGGDTVELLPLGVVRDGRKLIQVSFTDAETGQVYHIRGANWRQAEKLELVTDTETGYTVPADVLFEIDGWTGIRYRAAAAPKEIA